MRPDLHRAAAAALVACLLLAMTAAEEDMVKCLKGLKDSLHDPTGNLNWDLGNQSIGFSCRFNGVKCWSDSKEHVISLNLPSMSLSGEIPSALQYCTFATTLDLSSNFITGEIPTQICNWLPFLQHLDLSGNQLSGPIPPDFFRCIYLRTLNLSGNRLSGVIPDFLNSSFEASSFSGNAALCGSPLSPCDGGTAGYSLSKASLAVIIAAGVLGGAVSLLLSYSAFRWYLNQSKATESLASSFSLVPNHQRIREWVERRGDLAFLGAADGLAALEVVGRGGCGEVYRAQLDRMTIAIKKVVKTGPYEEESRLLDRQTRQARSEIITVGRIRHRNLLPLLAHVPRPDCNYLVYEFMNNGSLHDAIVRNDGLHLDWLVRHRIAVGIATGLEHLHHHHKPNIVHRDLKPANILLDDGLEAKISDFGLAKEFPDAKTHISMSKVAGTIGYIAPEYYRTLKFTPMCDIYSLGVILAVLVTGKLPSDGFFRETEMSMVNWLRNVMGSGDMNPGVAIDERLLGQGFDGQMELVLRISCFCTADDPNDRPTSKDVRCMLSQIKH